MSLSTLIQQLIAKKSLPLTVYTVKDKNDNEIKLSTQINDLEEKFLFILGISFLWFDLE